MKTGIVVSIADAGIAVAVFAAANATLNAIDAFVSIAITNTGVSVATHEGRIIVAVADTLIVAAGRCNNVTTLNARLRLWLRFRVALVVAVANALVKEAAVADTLVSDAGIADACVAVAAIVDSPVAFFAGIEFPNACRGRFTEPGVIHRLCTGGIDKPNGCETRE